MKMKVVTRRDALLKVAELFETEKDFLDHVLHKDVSVSGMSVSGLLRCSFVFSKTRQGYTFWHAVCDLDGIGNISAEELMKLDLDEFRLRRV